MLNAMGRLRLQLASILVERGHLTLSPTQYNFLWVRDFPLFSRADPNDPLLQGRTYESTHHPFTSPHPEEVSWLSDPSKTLDIRGLHYDIVLNGVEIGGGSIRNHCPVLQRYILEEILHVDTEQFKHLLEALSHGTPPHGGLAIGFGERVIVCACVCLCISF